MVVTSEEYEVINDMYMCADNISKEGFCWTFKRMNLISHVQSVVKKIKCAHDSLVALSEHTSKVEEKVDNLQSQCIANEKRDM